MQKSFDLPILNSRRPVETTPEDYEKQVVSWLASAGAELPNFTVTHLKKVQGYGGDYSIDGWVEFELFGGTQLSILVECKRHGRPVERDIVLGVHAKAEAVGAHKAIIFSTSGFQSGAVEFASSVGMALVVFSDGKATYMTRSSEPISERSYPPYLPKFVGQLIQSDGGTMTIFIITEDCVSPLADWLVSVKDIQKLPDQNW